MGFFFLEVLSVLANNQLDLAVNDYFKLYLCTEDLFCTSAQKKIWRFAINLISCSVSIIFLSFKVKYLAKERSF